MATRKSELVITCNAKAVKDVFEYLNRQLADVKQKLKDLNAKGEKSGWTEQMKKDFRDLTKQATAIDSAIIHNQQSMVKYGQVLKDLSGSKLKDLKTALREATTSLNKMSEKSPGRQKLIDDIKRIKDQISGNNGLTMSFKQAQTQLKNLDNVSMEKLKQGLAAIKSQLDNPNIGNKWRRSLEQMQQQYQAAMAVRTAPVGTMPVTRMNAQQLGAERTALMSALAATNGVKGYEGKAAGYEQRLKAVNEQLKLLTDNEKKADQAAKQLQATQEAAGTVRAVYRGQAVELEKLQAAYRTLQARQQQFAGTNDAKARAAAQQMALLKNRIDKVTAAMQAEIKIDKQFLKTATNAQLQNALTQLQQKLQSLNSTQSATAQKLKQDMKAVEAQIRRNTGAIQQQGGTFGTAIKNIAAYVGVFGAFNMIKSKVMEVYKSNLKLSDSLADIRKVSGLTIEEINKLYNNISKIDSRNTIETLNKLAYTGAKLGIGQNYGVQGLTGFVRAAEQVQMALGEDLGEDALPALAKLTEVMNLIPKYGVEQAMQKAASAIFQLGATSTATGKNIVEFSKRLMGLANVSRVSADELLAIGSAADAMGLMPEVAATAFNKLFTSIQKNHNLIEKSLQLEQGSINANFAKGQTIKSIIDIFDSMNKRGNMNALDGIFKDLGSDGARLVAVMTTMADRVDILKTHLATSTKAFKDGTAVINEYMIQNETANALMERAQNLWAKAFTNPEGVDMVKQLAEQWYEVSKALTQSEGSMKAFHNGIEGITSAVITLIKMLPFLIKMLTWFGIFGGIRMMVNSFAALIVSIRAATTATATLQAVMNSNWVLAGIAAVVGGISLYIDNLNAAAEAAEKAQKRQAELDMQLAKSKEAIDTVAAPLESYKRALDDSNYSLEKRNQLLKDLLKSDYQQYLDYLGIEIDGAIDLAKAYAMVVKVLKQKKAYEEREQYRDEVNQNNKIDRMRAGMQFGQTAKALGSNVDAEWLRQRHNLPVEDIMASVVRSAGGSVKAMDFGRGAKGYAYYDKAGNLIEATVLERLRKNIREYSTSRNTENRLNREVDELYKNEVGDFDMEKFQEEALKGQLKRKGQLDNLKPDKDAEKAAKKAQQEEKKALRKEMEDAQKDSTAVINAIEEFYRLQESAAEQMVADGKLTRSEADKMIEYLRNRKDEMLLEARRAITGNKNNFEELRKTMGKDVLRPGDEATDRAKETVQTVDVQKAAANLKKFDGSKGVYDLNSGSFTQSVLKNAAQNELNIQRRQAKMQEEIDKILRQYQFVEQAQQDFGDDLVKLGLITSGYEKMVQQLADGTEVTANTRDVQALGEKVTGLGTQLFNVDMSDAEELRNMVNAVMTKIGEDGERVRESFASMFPDLDEWMENPEQYLEQIQVFYKTLLDYDKRYYDAIKKSYDNQKKLFEERWETSGKGQAYANIDKQINIEGRRQKITGADQGTNFAQLSGFATVGNDPEVQASLLRMAQMQEELEMFKQTNAQKKLEGEELLAYQQGLFEKQQAMQEAEIAMQEALMNSINDHISKLNQWTEPIQTFATDVGTAMGEALVSGESMAEGMQNALKSLVKSWGESTIQILKDLMMQQLRQKLVGKMMVKQEKQTQGEMSNITEEGGDTRLKATTLVETGMASVMQTMGQQMLAQKTTQDSTEMAQEGTKTTGTVMAGIAQGAAKIIGTLGPWGAPLIAVITALLMGLLSMALGALGGGSKSSGNEKAATKVKLKSGMLTYDEGNVQTVVGDDGHVYRAREQRSLPSGVSMITEPIATRVNGQEALVGERGPEIVIGRKTTRAIQMNRPDLLRDLAMIDRGITTRKVRAFDEGNLSDLASAIRPADDASTSSTTDNGQSERDQLLMQTMQQMLPLMQGMTHLLQNPVAPNINMYGENGLHKKIKQADQFMKRYSD